MNIPRIMLADTNSGVCKTTVATSRMAAFIANDGPVHAECIGFMDLMEPIMHTPSRELPMAKKN